MNYVDEENLFYKKRYRVPSARLAGWNYADEGFYFITICIQDRKRLCFGDVIEEKMVLSGMGKIVEAEWKNTGKIRKNVDLDEYVVMPNHFHGILHIVETHCMRLGDNEHIPRNHRDACNASLRKGYHEYKNKFGPQSHNVSAVIRGFKGAVTKKIWATGDKNFVWQERFYDRVIRNLDELNRIRQYIMDNPTKWYLDRNHPQNL